MDASMTLNDTSVHGRTPVIVGVGQYMEWGRSPTESLSPMGIAAAAGAAALKDTGVAERVSETLDALVSVRIFPDSGIDLVRRIHSGVPKIRPTRLHLD